MIITDPSGTEYTYALRLEFPYTNDEVDHEALAGFKFTRKMKVDELTVFGDSRLVVYQVWDTLTQARTI